VPTTARVEAPPPAPVPAPAPAPLARAGFLGVLPAPSRTTAFAETPPAPAPVAVAARPEPAREAMPQRETTPPPAAAAAVPSSRPQTRSGWMIQVGAYPAESEAKERLALAKSKASRLLASASPFTEPVQRGETTLYRARFAGFEREQAEAACKFLKRNDVDCLAIRN
jgi:D-alanyl-D-alanine carboxypeptidase